MFSAVWHKIALRRRNVSWGYFITGRRVCRLDGLGTRNRHLTMYLCTQVRIHEVMYVCILWMYVCTFMCVPICSCMYNYACMVTMCAVSMYYIIMYVCTQACLKVCIHLTYYIFVYICIGLFVRMCACVCICPCVHVCFSACMTCVHKCTDACVYETEEAKEIMETLRNYR